MQLPRHLRALPIATVLAVFLTSGCSEGDRGRAGSAAGSAAGADAPCPAIAGETIRWIVPFTPGGGYDVYSRLIEPYLEAALQTEIVVENRVGAGGRVGTRAIRDARPDGRTLGMVNATSLLVSELSDELSGFHPVEDLTAIGRIAYSDPVWATASDSEFHDIEALLAEGREEPLLFGITDVGSTGFVSVSVAAELLGLELIYLPGYPGSRETSLGLIRGEFDLGGFTLESILDRVEAGDLRPVLQIADAPFSEHASVRDVPVLAGPRGLVARTTRATGADSARAVARADAVVGLFQAGRLVVAPPGLDGGLAACLAGELAEISADPAFLRAAEMARRTIAFQHPNDLTERLRITEEARRSLAPILRRHIEMARLGTAN